MTTLHTPHMTTLMYGIDLNLEAMGKWSNGDDLKKKKPKISLWMFVFFSL